MQDDRSEMRMRVTRRIGKTFLRNAEKSCFIETMREWLTFIDSTERDQLKEFSAQS